jgi:transcriptional regulator with XRE-family HTH domain
MRPAPPKILKIAREFLGLSQDDVEAVFGISRKTVQRLERGDKVVVHYAISLQSFYEVQGIEFVPPADGRGWGVFNANTEGDPSKLNGLGALPPSKRIKATK